MLKKRILRSFLTGIAIPKKPSAFILKVLIKVLQVLINATLLLTATLQRAALVNPVWDRFL